MSWECEPCHIKATGKDHMDAGHYFGGSRGRCETCGVTSNCADCHCDGQWGTAARQAGKMTEQRQVSELRDILTDTS